MTKSEKKIEITKADWTFEGLALAGIIFTLAIVVYWYNDLPDALPRHYNASGQADGFGGKSLLFILPGIGIITYALMTIVTKFPHLYNFPFEISEANAELQYKNMTRMIRILKIFIMMITGYLTYATIQNGLGKMQGIGVGFLPVMLLVIFGTIGYFMYKASKLR